MSLTSHIKMTCPEWLKVKDNPIQRDTERHAAKAKHLLTPLPVHAVVSAARLPSGQLVKLDGHTRALLWARNVVPQPKQIEVHLYDVASLEEAAALYKTFDSRDALETTPDKVAGALKGMGYVPVSGLVASGSINSALNMAWAAVYGYAHDMKPRDVYETINEFAVEIIALDELGLRKGVIKTGVVAAVLMSYRKHNDKVLPFWRAVVANAGTKSGGRMDAVQALVELTIHKKSNFGGTAQRDLLGRALMAVEKWMQGDDFSSVPRPLDVASYLENADPKRPKFKLVRKMKASNGAHASA